MMDGLSRTMPEERDVTLHRFDQLKCHVKRKFLDYYDHAGGWVWYYLTDRHITLPELAYAFHGKNHAFLARLVDRAALSVHTSLEFIPGDEFHCIYYRDAGFFLSPCRLTQEMDDGGNGYEKGR
jgi:hypothetical protein